MVNLLKPLTRNGLLTNALSTGTDRVTVGTTGTDRATIGTAGTDRVTAGTAGTDRATNASGGSFAFDAI